MFNLINIGECSGSGIPSIINVWDRNGWSIPEMREITEPDRVIISLEIETSDKNKR